MQLTMKSVQENETALYTSEIKHKPKACQFFKRNLLIIEWQRSMVNSEFDLTPSVCFKNLYKTKDGAKRAMIMALCVLSIDMKPKL